MKTAIILASLILALSGCANMSEQQKSTAIGAAVVGAAVVGGATGSWGAAAAGGIVGGVIGHEVGKDK